MCVCVSGVCVSDVYIMRKFCACYIYAYVNATFGFMLCVCVCECYIHDKRMNRFVAFYKHAYVMCMVMLGAHV